MPTKKRSLFQIKKEEHALKMQQIDHQMAETNRLGDINRARAVTVGAAGGGTVEIGQRANNGTYIFSILQPVEAIELIHQLSANVGCHLHLTPRQDFSSWRGWKMSEEELLHYRGVQPLPGEGHPPHLTKESVLAALELQANMPEPEEQPGLAVNIPKKMEKTNAVATKKAVNKRRTSKTKASS